MEAGTKVAAASAKGRKSQRGSSGRHPRRGRAVLCAGEFRAEDLQFRLQNGVLSHIRDFHFSGTYPQALQDLLQRSETLARETDARDRRQAAAEFGLFPPTQDCVSRVLKASGVT